MVMMGIDPYLLYDLDLGHELALGTNDVYACHLLAEKQIPNSALQI